VLTAILGATAILAAWITADRPAGPPPHEVVRLTTLNMQRLNSLRATISASVLEPGGDLTTTGTLRERLHPDRIAEAQVASALPIASQQDVIITAQAAYFSINGVAQSPASLTWLEVPFSDLGTASAVASSMLWGNVAASDPVVQTQMIASSPDVHLVGPGVIAGVRVTEYAGSYPVARALASLPASTAAVTGAVIGILDARSATFQVWIDGQSLVRKITVIFRSGKTAYSYTETITGTNEPVSVQQPPASQTTVVPPLDIGGTSPPQVT
jgi:hypothetical protein